MKIRNPIHPIAVRTAHRPALAHQLLGVLAECLEWIDARPWAKNALKGIICAAFGTLWALGLYYAA